MNGFELKILLAVLGVLVTMGLLLASTFTLRYRVTPAHLQVTWLGLPVRRLRLDDIKRIGTRPVVWAERWPNSWDRGRVLVIRRKSGWFRNFVITPKLPFEFRNTIEQARNHSPTAQSQSSLTKIRPPVPHKSSMTEAA